MDQFEAARLKTAKREARKVLSLPVFQEESGEPEIPKEKPVEVEMSLLKSKKDGKFTVMVEMPHASFRFVLTKQSILSHAPSNRLTQSEIRKHIIEGLKPLLGGLD